MTATITSISADEWDRVHACRQDTLDLVLRRGVTRDEFAAAAAVCYAAIGQPAPAVVVAPSPLVALAWSAILCRGQLYDQLSGQLYDQLSGQLRGQLDDQLYDQLGGQLGGQLYGQLYDQLRGQLYDQLGGQLGGQLYDQLGGQLSGQLDDQLSGQLYDQLSGQLRGQLDDQLSGQLGGQLDGQLYDQLGGQLYGQLYGQLSGQLRGQLYDQLSGQLYDQLGGQLRGQLDDQLSGQLRGQLYDQLRGQLRGQLRDQLRGQLDGQPRGIHWSGWRTAWTTHWLHINTLPGITPAPVGLTDTLAAYRTMCAPTFTIPLTGVVIGLGPHVECHMTDGQLHNPAGPAWSWLTGETIHAWRGTAVPEWVITAPTVERIAAEPNSEIRRCAIESLGWSAYLDAIGVTPVSVEDDPGNPGHTLALYDVPGATALFGGDVRLLVMANASRDRDGTRRTYAETVPADIASAIAAAAWQFDVPPDIYRTLRRAT